MSRIITFDLETRAISPMPDHTLVIPAAGEPDGIVAAQGMQPSDGCDSDPDEWGLRQTTGAYPRSQ